MRPGVNVWNQGTTAVSGAAPSPTMEQRSSNGFYEELGHAGRRLLRSVIGPEPWAFRGCRLGFAGQFSALTQAADGRRAFVKCATNQRGLEHGTRELGHLTRLSEHLPTGSPHLLGGDARVLIIEEVASPGRLIWDETLLAGMVDRLDEVARIPPHLVEGAGLVTRESAEDWVKVLRDRLDRTLLGGVEVSATEGIEERDRRIRAGDAVVAHNDAWPRNWMCSAGQAVLIDFDHLSLAPKGWDTAWCLSQMGGPGALRWRLLKDNVDADFALSVSRSLLAYSMKGLFDPRGHPVLAIKRPAVRRIAALLAAAGDNRGAELAAAALSVAAKTEVALGGPRLGY